MSEVLPVHTSCNNCVFAKYDGNTQIECTAKQLDKFKKHNIEILEAYDEENREFFIINGRRCRLARSHKWLERLANKKSAVKAAKQEVDIKCHAIVISNDNLKDIKKTILSLKNQKLKPALVTVLRPFMSKTKPSEIINILRESGLNWRVENLMVDRSIIEGIDLAVLKNHQYLYYSIFNSGYAVPKQFFSQLNKSINDELIEFAALLPVKDNGLTVFRDAHLWFGGNKVNLLLDKLKEEKVECQKISEVVKCCQIS